MTKFLVPELTTEEAGIAITEAVASVDDGATVDVDVPARELTVQSTAGDAAILKALTDAGYPATAVN